jgi:hypothetical protein
MYGSFFNKSSTDFSDNQNNSINNDFSDQTDASKVQVNLLVSASVSNRLICDWHNQN